VGVGEAGEGFGGVGGDGGFGVGGCGCAGVMGCGLGKGGMGGWMGREWCAYFSQPVVCRDGEWDGFGFLLEGRDDTVEVRGSSTYIPS